MRDALMRLLEPPIEALGFELLDDRVRARRGGAATLRIFIDRPRPAGDGARRRAMHGAEPGRHLGGRLRGGEPRGERVLDAEDPIEGHYTLEVSSPGWTGCCASGRTSRGSSVRGCSSS